MNLEPIGTKARRKEILRGVYEDNLKMSDKPVAPAKGRARRARWSARIALAGIAALVVLGGFQVYQEIQAKQRTAPAAGEAGLASAERMAREFGSPDDPGLTGEGLPALEAEVPIASLFGLHVKTIVIDPGHGGMDPGAVGASGLREKDVTLDVARRLSRRLERDYGYRILMTREDDRKMTLRQRIDFANDHGADLFISIHVNALPEERLNTIETYYFSPRADAQAQRLAELENQDSEYSFADLHNTFEKIGNTMKFQESKQLATSIQRTLYRNMHQMNGDVSDWGVRSGPFVVLLGVKVPAVLAEISVISNRAEEAKLHTPQHREHLAMSLAAGIVGYLNPDPPSPTEATTEYAGEKDD